MLPVDLGARQNADSASPLYSTSDAAHIGATGTSQAPCNDPAGADEHITTIAPIEGAAGAAQSARSRASTLWRHGHTLPCLGHMSAFNGITQPVMLQTSGSDSHHLDRGRHRRRRSQSVRRCSDSLVPRATDVMQPAADVLRRKLRLCPDTTIWNAAQDDGPVALSGAHPSPTRHVGLGYRYHDRQLRQAQETNRRAGAG